MTIVGNLTADPELRFTPSGAAVSDFTVASTNRVKNKRTDEWEDGDTTFIRCSVWEQYAENVAETLTKGMRVIVTGRLKVRQYEKNDGTKGTSVECTADEVGVLLKNASGRITRNQKADTQQRPAQTTQRVVPQPDPDPWDTQSNAIPF